MRTSWGLQNRVRKNSQRKLDRTLSSTTAVFFQYNTIPLKLYLEIGASSEFSRLVISGGADKQACLVQWEKIIQENNQHTGQVQYDEYRSLYVGYYQLITEYLQVKASFTTLLFVIDYPLIKELREMGFKIDLTDSAKYAKSLELGLKRNSNLITQARMKQSEMDKIYGAKSKEDIKPLTFDDIMGWLQTEGVSGLDDNLTLARYNAIRAILKKKNEPKPKLNGR